jgi:hypothetical protein
MPNAHRADRSVMLAGTLLLVFLFTLLPTGRAHACSCMFMEPDEALAQADVPAAFVGTLVAREDAGRGEFGAQVQWTFEVEAVLAGDLAEITTLRAPQDDGANCGLNLQVGDRTALILYSDGDGWSSSSCSTYDADAMLAAGDPQPPSPVEGEDGQGEPFAQPGHDGGLPVLPIAIAVLGAAAILAAVVLLARRARPTEG